jgi:hypothetical protein
MGDSSPKKLKEKFAKDWQRLAKIGKHWQTLINIGKHWQK